MLVVAFCGLSKCQLVHDICKEYFPNFIVIGRTIKTKKKTVENQFCGKLLGFAQPIEQKQMSNICQITQHKIPKAKSYVQKCFCLPMRRELLWRNPTEKKIIPKPLAHYFQPALSRQGKLIDFKINND